MTAESRQSRHDLPVVHVNCCTRSRRSGESQTNDDGECRRLSHLLMNDQLLRTQRNVAMPWRALQARHNRLGETIHRRPAQHSGADPHYAYRI